MVTAEKLKAVEFFTEGRKLYKMMDFRKAADCFKKALEVCPDDGPSKVYFERCIYYIDNPPPPDWDGVYVMKTK
ncbi:MAG: tetratricopeptide repeat protein [Spirochaetaceae bacterium]|nr:tetratricopeptide repeat protein [Spirochaetaceae bacterium]